MFLRSFRRRTQAVQLDEIVDTNSLVTFMLAPVLQTAVSVLRSLRERRQVTNEKKKEKKKLMFKSMCDRRRVRYYHRNVNEEEKSKQ